MAFTGAHNVSCSWPVQSIVQVSVKDTHSWRQAHVYVAGEPFNRLVHIRGRWGAVEEVVTDNGTAYVAALDWLADKFGIRHIRISAYNSLANGIVERQHRMIRDSIFKACEGDETRWPTVTPFAFWADRATTRKSTGHSPFFMVHSVEPILPFDLVSCPGLHFSSLTSQGRFRLRTF